MGGIPTIQHYSLPGVGALPANTVGWVLERARTVLLIHDMQRYFIAPLPSPLRSALVGNIAAVLARCRTAGVPVAYTTQPGRMTRTDRGLLLDFWGPGMQTAATDQAVDSTLSPATNDWRLTKWRYSAFFRTPLRQLMRDTGRDQLVLCGVYAHIGVLVSAIDAFTNDIQPFIVADGVADFSEAHHRQALEYTAQRCGKVVTMDEVFT